MGGFPGAKLLRLLPGGFILAACARGTSEMTGRLKGAVFVTGGSSGIGLAVAIAFARRGHPVVLMARGEAGLDAAVGRIRGMVPDADVRAFAVDVTDADQVARVMALAIGALGPPERLVLSAGMTLPGRWDRVTIADQRRVMEVNYFGCLNVLSAALPHLSAGAGVAFIGSAAGMIGTYGYGAYAPSKFALRGLAEVLRVELAPRGISVTLCQPPDTDTPMLAAERAIRPAVTSRMAEGVALARPEDVAEALLSGMDRGRFLVLPGIGLRLLSLFGPWIAPLLRRKQARLIRQWGEDEPPPQPATGHQDKCSRRM